MSLNFKNRLTYSESFSMVNEVCSAVFDENEETGTSAYLPELYDYAYRLAIAKYYGGYELSDDNEANYAVSMSICPDALPAEIDKAQLSGIERAIREKIEFRKAALTGTTITVSSPFEPLAPALVHLVNTLAEKAASLNLEKLNDSLTQVDMSALLDKYIDAAYHK